MKYEVLVNGIVISATNDEKTALVGFQLEAQKVFGKDDQNNAVESVTLRMHDEGKFMTLTREIGDITPLGEAAGAH